MNRIKKILIPIDFSDYSRHSLRYAIDLAKQFEAKMYLINVFEPPYNGIEVEWMIGTSRFNEDIEKMARNELDKLIKEEMPSDMEIEVIYKVGKPFLEIIETASQEDIDLIIIATHGQTGIKHLLFGSTAEKVIRKAPCPVLSIREPTKGFRFEK